MKISEYKEQYALTIIKLLIERCPRIIPRYVTRSEYYSRNTFRFVRTIGYNEIQHTLSFVKIWKFLLLKTDRSLEIDDRSGASATHCTVYWARKISIVPCTQCSSQTFPIFQLPSTSIFKVHRVDEKFQTSVYARVHDQLRATDTTTRGRAHFADAAAALLFSQLRFENPPSAGSNELSANAIPRVPQIFARLRGCYPGVATIHRPVVPVPFSFLP